MDDRTALNCQHLQQDHRRVVCRPKRRRFWTWMCSTGQRAGSLSKREKILTHILYVLTILRRIGLTTPYLGRVIITVNVRALELCGDVVIVT